ncbi:glutathione S-transferase [Sulfitobacter sp. D35]|uniref:glutathione S-transferase n=1 Tax=Sulfitobacter sp. D35 TaxID=3083252 RepID=UPI00296EE79A|nr:glutathione S-transferase [Sulfitobacter sp. D35]MDW4498237.1 glutathione S-transferase [Sulfitobacter sp. D35]
MKLFHSPASPYVRKVVVLLHELERADAVSLETVTTTTFAPSEAVTAGNPLSKIPALERPEGPTLYDSRVICAYLDDLFHGGLYPKTAARWDVLTLEATAEGIMDAAVNMAYEVRLRPEDKQFDQWLDAQWGKVSRAVAALNARWMSHLQGPRDIGHIGVACALGYLDFRHDARNWRAGNDSLAAWYETFAQRPSMQATVPPAA